MDSSCVRTPLGELRIWTVTNGIFPSNCYICETGERNDCFVVDPGLDAAPIESALRELDLVPQAVVCTHGHFDHAGSAAQLRTRHGCPVHLHEADMKTLRSSNFLLMAFRIPVKVVTPEIVPVGDSQPVVRVGPVTVRFHPAPGHTPGSCVLEYGDTLFTGDTLYARGVGLSRLPGEDAERLRASLRALWDRFPDATVVRPGHGETATFGDIKRSNEPLLRFLAASSAPHPQ